LENIQIGNDEKPIRSIFLNPMEIGSHLVKIRPAAIETGVYGLPSFLLFDRIISNSTISQVRTFPPLSTPPTSSSNNHQISHTHQEYEDGDGGKRVINMVYVCTVHMDGQKTIWKSLWEELVSTSYPKFAPSSSHHFYLLSLSLNKILYLYMLFVCVVMSITSL